MNLDHHKPASSLNRASAFTQCHLLGPFTYPDSSLVTCFLTGSSHFPHPHPTTQFFLILPWLPGPADVRYINPTLPLQPEPSTQTINPQPYEYQPFISPTYRTNLSEINMQSVTVLVNSEHTSCPKCGAGISDGTKSCGSCGSTCPA